jgi:hypothetical protein
MFAAFVMFRTFGALIGNIPNYARHHGKSCKCELTTIPEYRSFRDDGPNSGYCHLIIKKILKCQLPNVYGSVEIQMFIMSKYNTFPNCSIFDCCNDNRYIDIVLSVTCSQAVIAQSVRRQIFYLDVRGSYPVGARIFGLLLCFFFFFFLYIQMFLYYYETFYYLT